MQSNSLFKLFFFGAAIVMSAIFLFFGTVIFFILLGMAIVFGIFHSLWRSAKSSAGMDGNKSPSQHPEATSPHITIIETEYHEVKTERDEENEEQDK